MITFVPQNDRVLPLLSGTDPPGQEPRGVITIEVFRLNRDALIEDRAELFRRLERLKRRTRGVLRRIEADPQGPSAAKDREELRDMLAELNRLTAMCLRLIPDTGAWLQGVTLPTCSSPSQSSGS